MISRLSKNNASEFLDIALINYTNKLKLEAIEYISLYTSDFPKN